MAVINKATNQPKVEDTKDKNKTAKSTETTKTQTLVKENKMNEDNQKLNAELEKQKQEIERLKKQLAQAQKQTATKQVATVSKDEKADALKDKIEAILNDRFKASINNLANLDFDITASELNKSILHTNTLSANARKLLTSLNTYISLTKSENEQVKRNSFINGNTEQTAKNIMKFDYYLKKLVKALADKIAESIESNDKPVEILINESIEKYCEKYIVTMNQNKKVEIATLQDKYGDDEFEFDNRMDILNDKYYGNNGLLNLIKSNYISLLTKDIIISQINEIDYAEANNLPYVFGKDKIDSILDEIVGNHNVNEEEHTF